MDAGKSALPEFGKYRAVREIGRGATSIVYLAEEIVEGRTTVAEEASPENPFPNLNWSEEPLKPARVAVKLVDFTDDGSKLARRFRKLFATEAAVSSQLVHPNITRVFDWKVEENRAYLVMEYLEGETLDRFVTMDRLLPMHRTVGIIFKVAMALDYAHRRGIVNRDIKPANVMLLKDDEVKVMDFGLALNIKKNANVDSTFINGLGSPSYMSPEQIKGYTLNHQTDLYSLGVMFYQLLTGRLPFRATSTASLIYKIVNMEAVPVTQLNPDIPELTNKVIAKAMEKDLYSRYRLGSDMAKDLSAVRYQILEEDHVVPNEARWKMIRGLPVLGQLDDTDVWELLRLSQWRELPPATVLMHEGEEGKSFGFVLEGEVEIEKGRRAIDKASRGDMLGVLEWLDSETGTRSLSATTLTRVIYLEINPAAFAFATEELAAEVRRLATDAMLKGIRSAILLAKRVSPLAIHPAPDTEDAVPAAEADAGPVANPLGWGAFAGVAATVAEPDMAPPAAAAPVPIPVEPPAAPVPARSTTVVVQPMPAAAAATIAQLALGRTPPAMQDFRLDSTATSEFTDVPLLPDEDRPVPVPVEGGSAGELPSDAMLTTEMAPRFGATTAFSTSEMAPNFTSTTAMADATSTGAIEPPSELMPDFDVHQGAATSEMAPNFAGTTAFSLPPELPPAEPDMVLPAFDLHQDQDGMATAEMAPNFVGTTPFNPSDFTLPEAPAARTPQRVAPAPAAAAPTPDFASTVAFDAADLMVPAVPEAPVHAVPTPGPGFDPDKTMILSGGFDGSGDTDGAFTEELYPPVGSAGASAPAAASMLSGKPRPREQPPEDFDKTVEISGGFESQPAEEEEPLDDLFPPIKF